MNDLTRRSVRSDFSQREAHHARLFAKKKVETECYIYKNQYEDAAQIVALYKQGIAHSRDSSMGEFRSRKYVGYTNPADPATAAFYTLAFRRTE